MKLEFKKKHRKPLEYILFTVLVLYALSMICVIAWGFITTMKTAVEFRLDRLFLPTEPTFENYILAFSKMSVEVSLKDGSRALVAIPMQILYSIIYAGGCALAGALACFITAYATTRFKFKKVNSIVYNIILFTMVLPIIGSLPSQINVAQSLGLYNTLYGPIIMSAHPLGGMHYFIFYAMFKSLSNTYFEAAYIDGASELQVLVRIAFPLVFNTFLVIILLQFISYWNEFQTPMIFMSSYPTLALGVFNFSLGSDTRYSYVPMKITACFILIVPVIILFACFHEKMMGNLRIGGIKE